ncbi:MAG: hypothetical protein HUJ16_12500 [Kangiella sp.]|nr:hypothetical protein [Kangiella sp.]
MAGNNNSVSDNDLKRHEQYITIWAKAVDTQMHFNEMSVKSRQLGLTFVAAALGVGIVLLSRESAFAFEFSIGGYYVQLHIAVLLILGAFLALRAVRQLDLGVYHRMLRGAVTFGEDFEENYMKQVFSLEKGMTQTISHYSRHDNAAYVDDGNGSRTYTGDSKVTAEDKIKRFYRATSIFLILGALGIFIVTNLSVSSDPTPVEPETTSQSDTPDGKGATR